MTGEDTIKTNTVADDLEDSLVTHEKNQMVQTCSLEEIQGHPDDETLTFIFDLPYGDEQFSLTVGREHQTSEISDSDIALGLLLDIVELQYHEVHHLETIQFPMEPDGQGSWRIPASNCQVVMPKVQEEDVQYENYEYGDIYKSIISKQNNIVSGFATIDSVVEYDEHTVEVTFKLPYGGETITRRFAKPQYRDSPTPNLLDLMRLSGAKSISDTESLVGLNVDVQPTADGGWRLEDIQFLTWANQPSTETTFPESVSTTADRTQDEPMEIPREAIGVVITLQIISLCVAFGVYITTGLISIGLIGLLMFISYITGFILGLGDGLYKID